MTEMTDRVRELFREMAEEAPSVALLPRLEARYARQRRDRRATRVAAVAAAVAAVVAVGGVVVPRLTSEDLSVPTARPPEVFRLVDTETPTPGEVHLAVTFTDPLGSEIRPAYVVRASGGTALVRIAEDARKNVGSRVRLSPDGTRMLYLLNSSEGNVTVQDLVTGASIPMGKDISADAEISPDNRILAVHLFDEIELRNVRTGTVRVLDLADATEHHQGIGWSPDGTLLAADENGQVVVLDLDGREQARIDRAELANGSMSWAPDGDRLLLYDDPSGETRVASLDGGAATVVARPDGAVRALGWAGERVVWLIQDPFDPASQRLVTTDTSGGDEQTWMRFDVGSSLVETVSWSDALRGGPAVPVSP